MKVYIDVLTLKIHNDLKGNSTMTRTQQPRAADNAEQQIRVDIESISE